MSPWTVDVEPGYERDARKLPQYEQAVLIAAVEHVLTPNGKDVCSSEWGKSLGGGLYEFRVKKSLKAILENTEESWEESPHRANAHRSVLLRAFFTVHGSKIVLLLSLYDKRRDSSKRKQNREIKRARKALRDWQKDRSPNG